MRRDRVIPANEARSDYAPPAPRQGPRPRARVLHGDPEFLHDGRTVRLPLRGKDVDFFGVSVMATALGRSSTSVRRLIRSGVIPETPFRSPGRGTAGQRRLWSREDVIRVAAAAEELGLRGHRPRAWSGSELTSRLTATRATA